MKYITIIVEENHIINSYINVFRDQLPGYSFRKREYSEIKRYASRKPQMDMVIIGPKLFQLNERVLDYFKIHGVKIATWSNSVEKAKLLSLLKLNLDGYFTIGMDLNELLEAFKNIFIGNKYVHPRFSGILLDDYERLSHNELKRPRKLLTKREWQILEKMVDGLSNSAIAFDLNISEKTVKNHVSSILIKLKAGNRTNAVLKAVKNRWVTIN